MDRYFLYNTDAFEKIREIPNSSIDLILTDPPYNLGVYSTGNMKFTWRKEINNDLAKWDQKELIRKI